MNDEILRVWPAPDPEPLDDDALAEAYAVSGACVRVNFVTSVDGAVEMAGFSEGLSGPADKRVFKTLRALCDGLLVGAGTVRKEGYHAVRLDEPRRARRAAAGLSAYPTLVVVSRSLDLDPAQDAFAGAPVRPIVVTCESAPADRRAALSAVADVVTVGEREVDLGAAVDLLRGRGLRHLLSEGGPHLFGGLVAADRVDEVCLTVSALLAGAGAGRITAGPASAPRSLSLRLVLAAGDMLLFRYGRPDDPHDRAR
jgi:riboflavin biosynthesis pyrimidine reductase